MTLLFLAALLLDDSFVLRGGTVHTVSHGDLVNTSVLVRDGKIAAIGNNLTAANVIDVRGLHVYPGLIDAATEIGLVEVSGVRETSDVTEIGRLNPQLVALHAVNPSSEHIPVARSNGITMAAIVPEGLLLSGQVALIHLDGWTNADMGVNARAAVHLRMPTVELPPKPSVLEVETAGGAPPRPPFADRKRTYDRQMTELNDFFDMARHYLRVKQATDLRLEAMIPVLEGREPLLISVVRVSEILDAIVFGEKQHVKVVLCGAPEAYKALKELHERDVPVILGPTFALPLDDEDAYDRAYTTPADLQKAGVRFAFGTFAGKPNLASRNLPYQAAQAVAFGLPHDAALRALTLTAAEIWGVGNEAGSIDTGKWADIQVTNGDPMEASTQVRRLFIHGREVELETRQRELYLKYLKRP